MHRTILSIYSNLYILGYFLFIYHKNEKKNKKKSQLKVKINLKNMNLRLDYFNLTEHFQGPIHGSCYI